MAGPPAPAAKNAAAGPTSGPLETVPTTDPESGVATIVARSDVKLAALGGTLNTSRGAPSRLPAAAAIDSALAPINSKTLSVRKGDTLMKVLLRGGARRAEAHEAISALGEVFDPRKLQIGQQITLAFERDGEKGGSSALVGLTLDAAVDRAVSAHRDDQRDFVARSITKVFERGLVRLAGDIDASLYLAATKSRMPAAVLMDFIRVFSWDVDFQRDIQPGDTFEVAFERDYDENGTPVRDGEILYAGMTLSGVAYRYYRYTPSDDDQADYFDAKGQSVRKALMRTPVDGAKLTSGYGKRKHPILGYTRVHRGLDFGAPKGTPIYAAGDGVVEKAGWEGNYGRYIRLRHHSGLKTAYAHMHRIAKGIAPGKRVRQGQVIGYVGSTGMSTGPHLHYEVIVDGRKTNPLKVKLPTGRKLEGTELARFRESVNALEAQVAGIEGPSQVAVSE